MWWEGKEGLNLKCSVGWLSVRRLGVCSDTFNESWLLHPVFKCCRNKFIEGLWGLFYKSTVEHNANLRGWWFGECSVVIHFQFSPCQFLTTFSGHCLIGVTTLHSSGQQMLMALLACFFLFILLLHSGAHTDYHIPTLGHKIIPCVFLLWHNVQKCNHKWNQTLTWKKGCKMH